MYPTIENTRECVWGVSEDYGVSTAPGPKFLRAKTSQEQHALRPELSHSRLDGRIIKTIETEGK